tara:strand:+ start:11538 stop:12068 length:531 start_codon:yes stop_codon:yes gene_type:complete
MENVIMRNQKGFTLIELIIVIVVLGILAVTAAPQFFNFSGDARTSTVKGLKGNIQGAYQTVYAKAAVQGKLAGTAAAPADVEGIDTVYGYPAATADGIAKAASLGSNNEDWVFAIGDASTNTTTDVFYIGPAGFSDLNDSSTAEDIYATSCYVSYANATDANTPPTVTAVTTGCTN